MNIFISALVAMMLFVVRTECGQLPAEIVSAQQPECLDGWHMYADYCYLFSQDTATWAESQAKCRAFGAYLAEPDSAVVDRILASTVIKSRRYWLGGSDIESEGQWEWVTGRPFVYTNWIRGDPNNAYLGEDCLLYNWSIQGKWADGDCRRKEYFICQMPLSDDDMFLKELEVL